MDQLRFPLGKTVNCEVQCCRSMFLQYLGAQRITFRHRGPKLSLLYSLLLTYSCLVPTASENIFSWYTDSFSILAEATDNSNPPLSSIIGQFSPRVTHPLVPVPKNQSSSRTTDLCVAWTAFTSFLPLQSPGNQPRGEFGGKLYELGPHSA
jgi:hypothetical protein